jgi:hypothetical protein|tara:strand:+ start:308 stop:808 length:501 start_codon:yes stop_codon:yes gene_type:complete
VPSPEPKPYITALPLYGTGASEGTGTQTVVKLSSNESALGPSPEAERVYGELTPSPNRYPEAGGHELWDALADVHGIETQRIFGSNGSDHIIYLLLGAYAGPGDEVVVTEYATIAPSRRVCLCAFLVAGVDGMALSTSMAMRASRQCSPVYGFECRSRDIAKNQPC